VDLLKVARLAGFSVEEARREVSQLRRGEWPQELQDYANELATWRKKWPAPDRPQKFKVQVASAPVRRCRSGLAVWQRRQGRPSADLHARHHRCVRAQLARVRAGLQQAARFARHEQRVHDGGHPHAPRADLAGREAHGSAGDSVCV
jgi:hypothetical protein